MVFESLAMGAVPVVADFGGPGDIVHGDVGFKVSLTNEDDVVLQIEKVLAELARDASLVSRLRQQGMRYARQRLSWDGRHRWLATFCVGWPDIAPSLISLPQKRVGPQSCPCT